MDLIIQLIVSIIGITTVTIGFNFLKKYDEASNIQIKRKYLFLSIILFTIAGISELYLYYLITSTTPFTFIRVIIAILEFFIVSMLGMEIAFLITGTIEDIEIQINCILLFAAISVIGVTLGIHVSHEIQENKYEKNIVYVEDVSYTKEEYELIPEFDEKNNKDDSIVFSSISKYFYYATHNGKYEIYYIIDKDNKTKEAYKILSSKTKFSATKDDEKPYLEVRTRTQYAMDNNLEPPKEIVMEEYVEYILHVPQQDIDKLIALKNTNTE